MRYKNKKYQICHHQIRFFFKFIIHQNPFSAAPDPAGGAYDAPPDPLVGWSPFPSPLRTRRLRRLGSQAPSTQNPAYASALAIYTRYPKSTQVIYLIHYIGTPTFLRIAPNQEGGRSSHTLCCTDRRNPAIRRGVYRARQCVRNSVAARIDARCRGLTCKFILPRCDVGRLILVLRRRIRLVEYSI